VGSSSALGDQRRVLLCLHRRVMKTASADLPTFRSWPTTSKRPGASWRPKASSFCRSLSKRTGAPQQFLQIPTATSSCSAHPDERHAGIPAKQLCVDGSHSVLASALTGNPRNLASENPEAAERVT